MNRDGAALPRRPVNGLAHKVGLLTDVIGDRIYRATRREVDEGIDVLVDADRSASIQYEPSASELRALTGHKDTSGGDQGCCGADSSFQ